MTKAKQAKKGVVVDAELTPEEDKALRVLDKIPSALPVQDHAITGPLDVTPKEFRKLLNRRQQNRQVLLNWIKANLKPGIDYMRVWSKKREQWSKPTLLKPGSEKILGMLGVTPTFPNLRDYEVQAAAGVRMSVIVIKCEIINQAGQIVAHGVGGRLSDSQDEGDLNKSLKMAVKSAQIDATLRYGGLSEIFVQEPDAETDEIPKTIDTVQVQSLLELISKSPLKPETVAEFYNVSRLDLLPSGDYFRATKAVLKSINKAAEEAAHKAKNPEVEDAL